MREVRRFESCHPDFIRLEVDARSCSSTGKPVLKKFGKHPDLNLKGPPIVIWAGSPLEFKHHMNVFLVVFFYQKPKEYTCLEIVQYELRYSQAYGPRIKNSADPGA